jgi:hypothetical protein
MPAVARAIRVTLGGPFGTESELIETDPDVEIQWPRDLVVALRDLDRSFGMQLIREADALRSNYEVFLEADIQLDEDLGSFGNPASAWLHHPANFADLRAALVLVSSHTQSYLAAASALVDHSRRFRRKYAADGTPGATECASRLAATFGAELRVISCLRNYSMHHSLPLLMGQQGEVSAKGWPTVIMVDTRALLAADPSAAERAVLETRSAGIPLAPLVSMYSSHVVSFYAWLFSRADKWHPNARLELQELSQGVQDALTKSGLDDLPWLLQQLDLRKRHLL